MKIDNMKNCWKEEDKRISERTNINRNVSFQKLRSSFNEMKVWHFIRIIQWIIIMPLFFIWIVFPDMKNDGSALFYVALGGLILILISFCFSYIYHYIYLSEIDFSESISKVQKRISQSEMLDKKIYVYRLISLLIAFLCAYKVFGTPSLEPKRIMLLGLFVFLMIYNLFVRLKQQIPQEYAKVKSCLDEMENEEED
ncbi:hypothetical protein LJC57_08030 [Parabacteroides sp. OttesenSCG-928-G07]|nr:hypothetical protein [Parabacteroides sp. OttesenSCG-928-G21]MDL2278526.1 hypothetical protein [Parabacteroides sp. OttesenSCG-928-G07]